MSGAITASKRVCRLGSGSRLNASGTQTHVLADGLGSTRALTDGSGNVVATYEYDVFGAVRASSGPAASDFRFTGQPLDPSTSLYYLRARYYDPSVGRFLSQDPFPGVLSNPTSHHPYSYVQNNPSNWIDLSGEVADLLDYGASGGLGYVGGATALAGGYSIWVFVQEYGDDIVRGVESFIGWCGEQISSTLRVDVDPATGKAIRRVYEANPKHRDKAYVDSKGRVVSKAPKDGQGALDESTRVNDRTREGTDPVTGERVILRQHERIELEEEILEKWHGYVREE